MRRSHLIRFFVFGCFLLLLLWIGVEANQFMPATRQARAARLIRANLPPGVSRRQVFDFLISQGAECGTDSRLKGNDIFGSFPLVPPSAWGEYARWGVSVEWLENYDRGVGFAFRLDSRGRMVSFQVYPHGVRP